MFMNHECCYLCHFYLKIVGWHDALSNGGEHCLLAACGIKLATAGYGVFGIDYEGHGKSMGARCYIQKFENVVADCDRFFKSICGKKNNIFLAFYFST